MFIAHQQLRNLLVLISFGVLVSCGRTPGAKVNEPVATKYELIASVVSSPQTDLSKIGHLSPKGRVQDGEYNDSPELKHLIARGKESIPELIGELDNETKIEAQVLDYWSEIRVGDVALIILTDFFTDSSWQRTTIAGVGWDEFLERGSKKNLTGEQVLRNYIAKHGRGKIKDRWQEIWTRDGDRIFWDDGEDCFRVRNE